MAAEIEESLTRNLAFLCWLTDRVLETGPSRRRDQFVSELRRALDGHLAAVEEVVVPALAASGRDDLAGLPHQVHDTVRRELADALGCSEDTGECTDRQRRVLRAVPEMLRREHSMLLPLVCARLDGAQRFALTRELSARLQAG